MTSTYLLGVEFHQPRRASGAFGGDERSARATEQVQDDVPALRGIADGALNEFHQLHGGVQVVDPRLVDEPHVTLIAGAAPEVLAAVLPAVEDRFVLALVICSAQGEGVLRPDDECRPFAAGRLKGPLQAAA